MNLEIQDKIFLLDDLSINVYQGTKVVSFSGGTDSTLLLYLLMKYCNDDLIVFSRIFPVRHAKNLPLVTDLLKHLMSTTGRRNVYQVLTHIPTGEIDFESFKRQFNPSIVYTGMTQNPPAEVYNSWIIDERFPNREIIRDSDLSLKPSIYYDHNIPMYSPFINHNKKTIKQLYDDEGITDTIFELTNSCTDEISTELTHCGTCWWCQERKWAFGKL